jgi:hypothetical protein
MQIEKENVIPSVSTDCDYDTDARLQSSKRIDWRFVLPDSHLRQVAYIGPMEEVLVESLRLFCDSLTVFFTYDNATFFENTDEKFDLVILRSLKFAVLEKVSSVLKPSGYLYWEIDKSNAVKSLCSVGSRSGFKNILNRTNTNQSFNLFTYHAYFVMLANLGFHNIEVFWHRPNFTQCLEIIPLKNTTALNLILSRSKKDLFGRLKLAAGRFLLKRDLLANIVPCISIIAGQTKTMRP